MIFVHRKECTPEASMDVQKVLAIAYMYLSQEIEHCYSKVRLEYQF